MCIPLELETWHPVLSDFSDYSFGLRKCSFVSSDLAFGVIHQNQTFRKSLPFLRVTHVGQKQPILLFISGLFFRVKCSVTFMF